MMVNLYSIPRFSSVVRRLWLSKRLSRLSWLSRLSSFPGFPGFPGFLEYSNTRFLKKESDVLKMTPERRESFVISTLTYTTRASKLLIYYIKGNGI